METNKEFLNSNSGDKEIISMDFLFPGFEWRESEIVIYVVAAGIYTILLKNGCIIHFTPQDSNRFREWLDNHRIENIGWK